MNKTIIKICGMRDAQNIREVEVLEPDMMGFIFYPHSPRFVSVIPGYMPSNTKKVGIFVNEETETILSTAKRLGLDIIQLHGNESPYCCRKLRANGYGIIKAFPISDEKDIERTVEYEGSCDYYIFDTKTQSHGGSGIHFDWKLITKYNDYTPFLISGGIGIDDAERLKSLSHPSLAGFDLNSRFETAPAKKDVKQLKIFIDIIRKQQ